MSFPRRILPLIIFLILFAVAAAIVLNPPKQPSDAGDRRQQMVVTTATVSARPYQIVIESYGRVEPVTKSYLVAQVSGLVVEVNEQFNNGGSFSKNDLLLRIDDRDYRANVKVAEATLLDAKRVLLEEQARSRIAKDDWRRSGKSGEPDSLVLREPQLLAAQAGVLSAEASLERAQLDLERTRVRAPYNGRVLSSLVDLGQVVGVNEKLGEIYASDAVQVRLPLRNRDLPYIDPADINGVATPQRGDSNLPELPANVELHATTATQQVWPARLVRTEAAIDEASRQLHVVAEIHSDFLASLASTGEGQPQAAGKLEADASWPRIGQYVTARILGKKLSAAMVVPLSSIYQGSFVYVVEDGHLYRKPVKIAWQNRREALIGGGLQGGEELVLTPVGQVVSGTPVKVVLDIPESGSAVPGGLQLP